MLLNNIHLIDTTDKIQPILHNSTQVSGLPQDCKEATAASLWNIQMEFTPAGLYPVLGAELSAAADA